jgi:spore coat polysaccharide biosynthesis protein SpsF
MEPTIRIVLQARMGSSRRPGKTLADVAGKSLLARVLERLNAARRPARRWQMVVATSTATIDDPVEDEAVRLGYGCVRGSERNVLARYLDATRDMADDDVVVRATADNPLYCPLRTNRLVAEHLGSSNVYTGVFDLSPVVPEAVRVGALRELSVRSDVNDYCREHVTPFFRRESPPASSRVLPPTWAGMDPALRLTVDTPEDLVRVNRIYRTLIELTGADRPADWTLEQIYGIARGLLAAEKDAAVLRAAA